MFRIVVSTVGQLARVNTRVDASFRLPCLFVYDQRVAKL